MSTRILLLRENEVTNDTIDKALSESGAWVQRVSSTSDALSTVSRDGAHIDVALIENTRNEDLLEFLRILHSDTAAKNVPLIVFRTAPSLIPREMAVYDFLNKNRHVLGIECCITVSEVGLEKLLQAIQSSVLRKSAMPATP